MEGLVHVLLIQWALHRLGEETLVHVAVVRAERGREDLVADVESIDDADGVWTDRSEHLLEARLQHRHVIGAQAGELQSQKKHVYTTLCVASHHHYYYYQLHGKSAARLTRRKSPSRCRTQYIEYSSQSCMKTW